MVLFNWSVMSHHLLKTDRGLTVLFQTRLSLETIIYSNCVRHCPKLWVTWNGFIIWHCPQPINVYLTICALRTFWKSLLLIPRPERTWADFISISYILFQLVTLRKRGHFTYNEPLELFTIWVAFSERLFSESSSISFSPSTYIYWYII